MIESAEESTLIGVLEQVLHTHLTQALEGLLPTTINPYELKQVLDVSCRMGAWPIDLALSYPNVMVTGLENDARLVDMARCNMEIGNVHDVRFYEANPLAPFPFAAESFDLVHMLQVLPAFRPEEWPAFLRECQRVLKPGGVINLVSLSLGPSSSASYQRVLSLVDELLHLLRYNFFDYPGTTTPGVHLCRLLNTAGFTNITYVIRPVNFGGMSNASGRATCQLLLKNVQKLKPLFIQNQLIDDEGFDLLLQQKQHDIHDGAFWATGALFSVTADMPVTADDLATSGIGLKS
jgi:SAM-dependent methyltransferase